MPSATSPITKMEAAYTVGLGIIQANLYCSHFILRNEALLQSAFYIQYVQKIGNPVALGGKADKFVQNADREQGRNLQILTCCKDPAQNHLYL